MDIKIEDITRTCDNQRQHEDFPQWALPSTKVNIQTRITKHKEFM